MFSYHESHKKLPINLLFGGGEGWGAEKYYKISLLLWRHCMRNYLKSFRTFRPLDFIFSDS